MCSFSPTSSSGEDRDWGCREGLDGGGGGGGQANEGGGQAGEESWAKNKAGKLGGEDKRGAARGRGGGHRGGGGHTYLKRVITAQAEPRYRYKQETEDGSEEVHIILPHKGNELPLQHKCTVLSHLILQSVKVSGV